MKKDKIISIALTVLLASGAIVGVSYALKGLDRQAGPEEVTGQFYREWINHEGNPMVDQVYAKSSLVTDNLVSKVDGILSSFESGGFDPVLCAQDKPLSFHLATVSENDGSAEVKATLDYYGTPKEISVLLKKLGREWRIDNIVCGTPAPAATSIDEQTGSLVGDYIRENISDLSPEPEVLGGTYYVTEIRFLDQNHALVEYEDGHVMHQARASFRIENGEVTVTEFDILPETAPQAGIQVEPGMEEENEAVAAIRQEFMDKYGKEEAEIDLEISQELNGFYKGVVRLGNTPGDSGIFLAVKSGSAYKLIADGNGLPDCEILKQHEIPAELIPQDHCN